MKAAGIQFEQNVSCHIATGSDLGDMSHGRKQFLDILKAAEICVDMKVSEYLSTPLERTKLALHFYVTADKATIHRAQNQAILICPFVEGRRAAIVVQAPSVYEEDEQDKLNVTGANSDELAQMLHSSICKAYATMDADILKAVWQGTVCDGQYKVRGFQNKLKDLLGQEEDNSSFNEVIWDPPHLVLKACEDVLKGKKGTSESFMDRLITRTMTIHKIFQRGKMLAQARRQQQVMAEEQGENNRLLLTRRACTTRFITSQYAEFMKLVSSLPTYIKTFRSHSYKEIAEYEIAGQDFVMDLLGCCDVLMPIMRMLVDLQALQVPIWKIAVWWPKVKEDMELMDPSLSQPSGLERNLKMYGNEVQQSKSFKGEQLVDGWLLTDTEKEDQGSEVRTVQNWVCREIDDCIDDLNTLKGDIIESMDIRFDDATSYLQSALVSLDLDTLFNLLCGKRSENGKVEIDEAALELFGVDKFREFYRFVCSQNHVRKLQESDDLLLNHALSHVVHRKLKMAMKEFLWQPQYNGIISEWFVILKSDPGNSAAKKSLQGLESLQTFAASSRKFGNEYSKNPRIRT